MTTSFNYSKFVVGKNFLGRKNDVNVMNNFLLRGENIFISEPPKSGKHSLIHQSLFSLKSAGQQFIATEISLLGIRTSKELTIQLGSAIIKACFSNPTEFAQAVTTYLADTHLVFDNSAFSNNGPILSLNWDVNEDDLLAVLKLPYKIAADTNNRIIIIIHEFQDILLFENGEDLCKMIEDLFKQHPASLSTPVSFVFSGSQINAMNYIFGIKKYFYRQVERVSLSGIDTVEIIEHIVRGYLETGKVVNRDILLGVCKLFRNNIWYINHFSSICDSLTKGYIIEATLNEALNVLLSIHEPKFIALMDDLTTFQVNLLRAILNGCTRFSSSDIIRKYELNSSANVRRLKDALCKKEIVFFNEDSMPVIIDPLFEYWATKYFFGIKYE